MKAFYRADKCDILFCGLMLITITMLYFLIFADMPIYGDAWGYGYNCARWVSDNGLPLISSGTGRGETAGGHVTFYFWMWAVLMKTIGNTVMVAHILPSIFAFFAVIGTYRLGRDLGGRMLGIMSGVAILVSPLFLAQAFRPLPISAAMAASVWSLLFYQRKRYFLATVFCIFAVMMREQALVLPIAYIVAELYFFKESAWKRIFLLALPFLVPGINGVVNYIVNGFIILECNAPGVGGVFSTGLILERLKFFGFFLTGHFRWLPIGASIGILYSRLYGKKIGLVLGLVLCAFGAVSRFQNYFTSLLVLSLFYSLIFRKPPLKKIPLVMVLVPMLMLMFFTVIKLITTSSMEFMFFRYLMAAFPALIIGMLWLLAETGRKGQLLAGLFIVATAVSNFYVRYEENYTDSTLVGYQQPLMVMRDAGSWAADEGLPIIAAGGAAMLFIDPALGYTDTPLAVVGIWNIQEIIPDRDYSIVVPPGAPWGGDNTEETLDDFLECIDASSRLEPVTTFKRGPFRASCYILRSSPGM